MVKQPLDAVLENPRIPTLPAVAMQVLQLAREDADLRKIAQTIRNDQALAVKVVRTVNSSFYGLSAPCATIDQAIVYLGLNAVKGIVLGFSLASSIDGGGEDDVGFDYVDYWRRALYAAVAARQIASITSSCEPEEAFLAALIQDVGMVALFRTYGDVYLQVVDLTNGDHRRLVGIEERSLQTDHAAIGAALAEHWRFPGQFVEAIWRHHEADKAEPQWRDLARCVQLATDLGDRPLNDEVPPAVLQLAHRWFNLQKPEIADLLPKLGREARELSSLLELDSQAPTAADPERLLSEAEDIRVEHEVAMARQLGDGSSP